MKKHVFRLLISLSFILLFICSNTKTVSAGAGAPSHEYPDYIVEAQTDGTYKMVSYIGHDENVVIPSEMDGLKVTVIGAGAFASCSTIKSVTIPEGVISIEYSAFCRQNLESVTLPQSLESIGDYAFKISGLKNVTIPEGVTSIGEGAFKECDSLESVSIPGSITNMGKSAFENCTGLKSVTISEGVTSVSWAAFCGCTNLTSVSLPQSLTSVGQAAFMKCSQLESISLPEGVTSVGPSAFNGCSNLSSVSMPGVTTIDAAAFVQCTSLTNVDMPKVETVGPNAFNGCTGLTKVDLPAAITIEDNAFTGCRALTTVIMPNVQTIGSYAFVSDSALTTVIMPKVTTIGEGAFVACGSDLVIYGDTEAVRTYALNKSIKNESFVPVESLVLDNTALTMNIGDSATLVSTITPNNATVKNVSWSSSNSSVVSVDNNGNLVACGAGTAVISATACDGSGKKAECTVTVNSSSNPEVADNASRIMNSKLSNSIMNAAKSGLSVVYFEEYNGEDSISYDTLNILAANPNVTLVLDYTFFDTTTNQDIHVHVVINQAILSRIMTEDTKYYGPACLSGFVQYYNLLPADIRNKNY